MLEAERREIQNKLTAREVEFTRKADELRRQHDELTQARESFEENVRQRLQAERGQIANAEEALVAHRKTAKDCNSTVILSERGGSMTPRGSQGGYRRERACSAPA